MIEITYFHILLQIYEFSCNFSYLYAKIIMDNGQIILFQTQEGEPKIEVRLADESVWLTADQMSELFQHNKLTISRHIKNIFESGELLRSSVVAEKQLPPTGKSVLFHIIILI